MKILVSSDTSCVLNYGLLKKHGISFFPLNVIVDGEEFLDGVNISQQELAVAMRSNKIIKTSTPPLGVILDYFENLFEQGYDHIIHFTISSKLSSMYNLFKNVSESYFENKITVIDSYSLSCGMLNNVLYANEEVSKGTNLDEICANIEERKKQSLVLFIPENLTALKNGGRISSIAAAFGNTIGLKPIISLVDGELVKTGMTTVLKKAFNDKFVKLKESYLTTDYDYSLVHFDAKENIFEGIINNFVSLFDGYEPLLGVIPINVCAHCGPGSIGVVVSPKINGKSLKDFI